MSLQSKIATFDPNGIGLKNGHFIGLPFNEMEAQIVLLSIPWDVTVSYNAGTALGPLNILEASPQLDLYDPLVPNAWKMGIFMRKPHKAILNQSIELRSIATSFISFLENQGDIEDNEEQRVNLNRINYGTEAMVQWVYNESINLLERNKLVGVVGGDHSTPLGFLNALAKKYDSFGILQIDAHMDLRKAYEHFTHSHASIFYNALQIPAISKLVQVGIRDFCEEEVELAKTNPNRIKVFFDHEMHHRKFGGESWESICHTIVDELPKHVYLSFDIDGLSPDLCPNTGTPVPGGLSFEEAIYLIHKVVDAGKTIIGFDLCEVAGHGHEWDGNVGARILYKMANLAGLSQKLNYQ
ncbi:MAG: agmatinase family protein [Bacteroidota bacterium]